MMLRQKISGRKIIKGVLLALVCAAVVMAAAGCGNSTDTANTAKKTAKKTKTYAAIGTKAKGKYVYQIVTTNATGKTITGFAIKTDSDSAYGDNMLTTKKPFKADQKRTLYYNAKSAIASASGDSGEQVNPEYTIQLTYDDNSTSELHDVPFDDIKTMSIAYDSDNSVAYLSYKSKGTKETVSTQADEVKIKQDADAKAVAEKAAQEKAAQQTAAAAAAKQQAATRSTTSASNSTARASRSTSSSSTRAYTPRRSYSSSSSSGGSSASSGTSSSTAAAASSNEGCVGDGETY